MLLLLIIMEISHSPRGGVLLASKVRFYSLFPLFLAVLVRSKEGKVVSVFN
jgi:hypothetical protein